MSQKQNELKLKNIVFYSQFLANISSFLWLSYSIYQFTENSSARGTTNIARNGCFLGESKHINVGCCDLDEELRCTSTTFYNNRTSLIF